MALHATLAACMALEPIFRHARQPARVALHAWRCMHGAVCILLHAKLFCSSLLRGAANAPRPSEACSYRRPSHKPLPATTAARPRKVSMNVERTGAPRLPEHV
eukprot:364741-Chlamydomonas_euryale.AAC.4